MNLNRIIADLEGKKASWFLGKILKLRLLCESPVAPHEKSIRSRLEKLSIQSTDHYDNFSYLPTWYLCILNSYYFSLFSSY